VQAVRAKRGAAIEDASWLILVDRRGGTRRKCALKVVFLIVVVGLGPTIGPALASGPKTLDIDGNGEPEWISVEASRLDPSSGHSSEVRRALSELDDLGGRCDDSILDSSELPLQEYLEDVRNVAIGVVMSATPGVAYGFPGTLVTVRVLVTYAGVDDLREGDVWHVFTRRMRFEEDGKVYCVTDGEPNGDVPEVGSTVLATSLGELHFEDGESGREAFTLEISSRGLLAVSVEPHVAIQGGRGLSTEEEFPTVAELELWLDGIRSTGMR
jgi:hypothetical protein